MANATQRAPHEGGTGPLLRRREVEREVGLSRTSIYDYMKAGKFPRPIEIAPHTVRWIASEVEAWKAERMSVRR